ncbi:N-acyl homoserine lactonase family protein [Herbiconiux sp. CPCC 205763]|uniref:N-acyl homoserine lactonase family protein n=1 Tax=Herbiconiux aconitum TaxID=2970913 RepID=A0ABT2GNK5_9MICO|nr:N-acyl homoserine lactonase family protein [Herbiconiux aconitum]MCS5717808.1 N-acyl homoserine lactonase family protein [Herbiconiux aconitum]
MSPIRRIEVFSTGQVEIRPEHAAASRAPMAWWLMTSRRWTAPRPINVYVIEHDRGVVLFDTGQDRASVTDPAYFPAGPTGLLYRRLARFAIDADQTLTAGLERIGLAMSDVDVAVLSHLHQDHIGGLGELARVGEVTDPGAHRPRILVDPAEWATLDRPLPEAAGLLESHIRLEGLNWETVSWEPADESVRPFARAHDLFGDGSLVLLPTPGHTPGSLSLLVRRAGSAPILLVGDLSYDVHSLESGHLPGVGNRARLRESTSAVNELTRRLPGLIVAAAHDPGAADAVRAVGAGKARG